LDDQVKDDEMGEECSRHKIQDEFPQIVGKTEDKRPIRRSRRRWEENVKVDLSLNWIQPIHKISVLGSCGHGTERSEILTVVKIYCPVWRPIRIPPP
jgi:hypothetical protein